MAENVALSAKQMRAIGALMTARSVDAAAEAAGVSARQLWRWLRKPSFAGELRSATADAIGQSARRLSTLSASAIDVLETTLSGDALELATMRQLRAADLVLRHLAGLRDLADIEMRLAALEDAHEQK